MSHDGEGGGDHYKTAFIACRGTAVGCAVCERYHVFSRFYMAFCSLMSHKYKEVHAAAAEVLGMVLAFKEERRDVSERGEVHNG